jgi:hypothetical protein
MHMQAFSTEFCRAVQFSRAVLRSCRQTQSLWPAVGAAGASIKLRCQLFAREQKGTLWLLRLVKSNRHLSCNMLLLRLLQVAL